LINKYKNKNIEIYYDGGCPFCTYFVVLSKLKKEYSVSIRNLRDLPDKVKQFKKKSYDVNEGMLVIFDDNIYFGHEAVYLITKLSDKKYYSSKIFNTFFSNKHSTKIIYPILKFFRNVTLKLLNRKKI